MATPTTTEMGDRHEKHLAEVFGGRQTKSSGNQWNDQGDVRNVHDEPFAFCVDGKSTKSKQIAITEEILDKIIEQSQGDRPAIGLRWYGNEKLTAVKHDWAAMKTTDVSELLEAARHSAELETELDGVKIAFEALRGERDALLGVLEERDRLREELATAQRNLAAEESAGSAEAYYHAQVREELAAQAGRAVPEYIPLLPWTIIHQVKLPGRVVNSGIHYDRDGHQSQSLVTTVWVERAPNSSNRPRLIANAVRVTNGDLYVDGRLHTRVAIDNPDIEVG